MTCDFVTLTADCRSVSVDEEPAAGLYAFDDLLAREPGTGRRWAYVGRFLGDALKAFTRRCAACSCSLVQPFCSTPTTSQALTGRLTTRPWPPTYWPRSCRRLPEVAQAEPTTRAG